MSPIFEDWHAVMSAVDCHKLGHNVFVENPCDHWGRVHVYGSLWLLLGKLGLGVSDVFWLGLMINAVFMLVAVVLINPSNIGELMIGAAVSFSPAVMFGIERANNDLIIFGLLVLAAYLIASQQRHGQAGGLFVTILCVFLKFYPAVLFGVIALVARNRREFLTAGLGGIALLTAWLYLSADELALLQLTVPRPPGPFATGGTLLFKYMCPTCESFSLSLGAAVAAVAALTLAFFLSQKVTVEGVSRQSLILFGFGVAVLLSTFLVNTNYDYRWVFFLLLVPMLLEIHRQPQTSKVANKLAAAILGFGLLVMWCEASVVDLSAVLKIMLGVPLSQVEIERCVNCDVEGVEKCLSIVKQMAAWLSLIFAATLAAKVLIESRRAQDRVVREEAKTGFDRSKRGNGEYY
jgi:hypothetical protein